MTIQISTAELLFDIRNKAHGELAVAIQDEKQRYLIEPGSEKDDELKRCLMEGCEDFFGEFNRFLERIDGRGEYDPEVGVIIGTAPCDIVIENEAIVLPEYFIFSSIDGDRRYIGKETAITEKVFSLISQFTLAKFYAGIGNIDLAKVHSNLASLGVGSLTRMLYIKKQPRRR